MLKIEFSKMLDERGKVVREIEYEKDLIALLLILKTKEGGYELRDVWGVQKCEQFLVDRKQI